MADESIRALFPHCLWGMFSRMRVACRDESCFSSSFLAGPLGPVSTLRLHASEQVVVLVDGCCCVLKSHFTTR